MTTVETLCCQLNMHVTFDLAEIEELMPQQARKQLEAELEKSCCSLGGVRCLYTAINIFRYRPSKAIPNTAGLVPKPIKLGRNEALEQGLEPFFVHRSSRWPRRYSPCGLAEVQKLDIL